MEAYPHVYAVTAAAQSDGPVAMSTPGVAALHTAPPAQFGGPGDLWSPETLLVAAVADCFALTFRGVARASNLAWTALRCEASGRLEREGGKTRFTAIALRAHLTVPPATDQDKARRLLEKAEATCLVSNSLAFTPTLTSEVEARDEGEAAPASASRPVAAASAAPPPANASH